MVLMGLLCGGIPAGAQTPKPAPRLRLALEPAVVELHVKPGMAYVNKFTVTLDGRQDRAMRAVVQDLTLDPRTGTPALRDPGTGPRSAAPWISVVNPVGTFRVPNHSKVTVQYNIDVPADAQGTYTAAIAVNTVEATGQGLGHSFGVAHTIFLVVDSPNNVRQARLEDLRFVRDPDGTYELLLRIQNIGNLHFFGRIHLEIKTTDGKRVFLHESPNEFPVLPGFTRVYRVPWKDARPGRFWVVVLMDYQVPRPLIESRLIEIPAESARGPATDRS